ncbi:MAG: chitobiase/beta-hexosaminidase C-terminal domain-containing protein [Bacteroidota bacterium]
MTLHYKECKTKIALYVLCFIWTCMVLGQSEKIAFLQNDAIALAPPRIEVDSLLFKEYAVAKLILGDDQCEIRYTLDGNEVNKNSSLYSKPIRLNETGLLRAKGFHPQHKPSETIHVSVRKIQRSISTSEVTTTPEPHQNYTGQGAKTLVNLQKGSVNFRSSDCWLGFQDLKIKTQLKFEKSTEIKRVVFSLLNDQDSWIFLPKDITIHSEGKEIGSRIVLESDKKQTKFTSFFEVEVSQARYAQIDITITPLKEIPAWHPGKGTLPWTFIDEILIE